MTTPEEIEGSPPMREEYAAAVAKAEERRRVWRDVERLGLPTSLLWEWERKVAEGVRVEEKGPVTCATCRYFDGRPRRVVREAEPEADELAPASVGFEITLLPPEEGKCRLHGPVVLGWPTVQATDWCGEHRGR